MREEKNIPAQIGSSSRDVMQDQRDHLHSDITPNTDLMTFDLNRARPDTHDSVHKMRGKKPAIKKTYLIMMALCFSALLIEFFRREQDPCVSFTLIAGNLTAATLIFLGENHRKNDESIACMEHLSAAHASHKILAEAIDYLHNFPCEALSISPKAGRECYGLEDAAILEEQKIYKRRQTECSFAMEIKTGLFRYQTYFTTEKIIDDFVKMKLAEYESKLRQQKVDAVDRYRGTQGHKVNFLKHVLTLREQGHAYSDILNVPIPERGEMMVAREASILKGALSHHGMFRIAIVGAAHVNPDIFPNDSLSQEAASTFLRKLAAQEEPYAVLSMQNT